MNEFLNNVFTAESVEAIRNAHSISPSPEQKEEIKYKNVKMTETNEETGEVTQSVQTKTPVTAGIQKEELHQLERRLMEKIQEQSERISVIINSQNQMIKELNELQSKAAKAQFQVTESPQVQNTPSQEPVKTEPKKESQQTGAGEGLNPQDYSVEDIFYFGNKK